MNWLTTVFSSGVDKIVDSVGKAIDSVVTSDEEKLMLRNALQVEMNKLKLEMESKSVEFEKEITKRWQSDNQHWVTRLVRPMSIVYMLTLFGIVVMFDGNVGEFSVNEAYIPVIESLLITMVVSYFGSRGFEKYTKIRSKNETADR